jgi:hypothetical protein
VRSPEGADEFSPAARLGIGVVILLCVARVSREPFWTDPELRHPWALVAGATFLHTVVPGLVIGLIGQINGDGGTLDQRPAVFRLDVIVLRSDLAPPAPSTTYLGGAVALTRGLAGSTASASPASAAGSPGHACRTPGG